jgi:DNA-3-methyladenine glycosylase
MHWLLNFVTEVEDKPSAALIRAVEPLYDSEFRIQNSKLNELFRLGGGPARLTKWMGIDGKFNGIDVTNNQNLFITESISIGTEFFKSEKVRTKNIFSGPRIGVDYAGEHKNLPLRFYIKESNFVSK